MSVLGSQVFGQALMDSCDIVEKFFLFIIILQTVINKFYDFFPYNFFFY